MSLTNFEWDEMKEAENIKKHAVDFYLAQEAFFDPRRVIAKDLEHSLIEERYYCIGKVSEGILTVRFTWRNKAIRIIGAGYWRKGKRIYEKENKIHR